MKFSPLLMAIIFSIIAHAEIVSNIDASKKISHFIHNGDNHALYHYMANHKPQSGWKHTLNHYHSHTGFTALQRALIRTPRPSLYMINLLLWYGADPNLPLSQDIDRKQFGQGIFYKGWTAAHMAARIQPQDTIVNMLKDYGCDFKAKDAQGWTPRMVTKQGKLKKRRYY